MAIAACKCPVPAMDSKRNARSGFCQAGRLPLSDRMAFAVRDR